MPAKRFRFLAVVVSALVWSSAAPAADIDNGRNIAMRECAPCHIVAPFQRREVAEAPAVQGDWNEKRIRCGHDRTLALDAASEDEFQIEATRR